MIYEHDGEVYSVEITPLDDDRLRVTIGEETLTIEARRLADGGWLLNMDGQHMVTYCAADDRTRQVWAGGEVFTLALPQTRAQRRSAGRAGDLSAQMPGQVRAVLVAEGDTVEAGQTLVILEAMKMELRVNAPTAGRIQRVLVAAGDVVERGQHLVAMEE